MSVAFGLRNVADTDQGLREMARVCQPGGRVAVLEFSLPRRQPMRAALRLVLPPRPAADGPVPGTERPCRPIVTCRRVWGSFPHGADLVARMEAAGLSDVRCHALTGGIATLYVGVKRMAMTEHDVTDDRGPSRNRQHDAIMISHVLRPPFVVGITGASGAVYATRLLEVAARAGAPRAPDDQPRPGRRC